MLTAVVDLFKHYLYLLEIRKVERRVGAVVQKPSCPPCFMPFTMARDGRALPKQILPQMFVASLLLLTRTALTFADMAVFGGSVIVVGLPASMASEGREVTLPDFGFHASAMKGGGTLRRTIPPNLTCKIVLINS